jgi:hypothetical protein
MKMKSLILAVISGVVITLLTGLLNHSPTCTRVICIVGEVYNGYPLAWVEMLAGASWFVRPLRLAADIVAWTIGVVVIMFGVSKARNKYAPSGHDSSSNTDFHV